MLVMTAKVDKGKLLAAAALVAAVIGLLLFLGGKGDGSEPAMPSADTNEARVKFLTDLGWEVVAVPESSMQVRIPQQPDEVFNRYNELQKSQGYDLSPYAGQTVMRHQYRVENYPGATASVYATLLIRDGRIIGGDITDTAPGGRMQGLTRRSQP